MYETPRGSIEIITKNGTICANVESCEVTQSLSEYWTCSVLVDFEQIMDFQNSGKTIEVGNTVNVWMGRGSLEKVFSGKVGPFTKRIEGHKPRYYEFDCRGWGEIFKFTRTSGQITDTIDNVIKYIVRNLTPNTISTNHVSSSNKTITFNESDISVQEALKNVCDKNDWLFYVDNNKDLWAFPIGAYTDSTDISNRILSCDYNVDPDSIINAQKVLGSNTKILGSDSEWTEDDDCSSCKWYSDGNIDSGGYSDFRTPDSKVGSGLKVIKTTKSDGRSGIYLKIEFRDAGVPKPQDLSQFGTMYFAMLYSYKSASSEPDAVSLNIYFQTNDSNYFKIPISIGGIESRRLGSDAFDIKEHYWGWHLVKLNFNLKKYPDPDMVVVGQPSWSSISSIKFEVSSPLPSDPFTQSYLMIDSLSFSEGYYYGSASDSSSISKYGFREGRLIMDNNYKSDTECDALAQMIVDAFKDPQIQFRNLETIGLVNIQPGRIITVTLTDPYETLGPYNLLVREAKHTLDRFDLKSRFELSNRFIPSIENILFSLQSEVEKIKKEAKQIPDSGLFRYGPLGLDLGDIDTYESEFENLLRNPSFEVQDRFLAPNVDVPACWFSDNLISGYEYRTDEQYIHGKRSLLVEGKTFRSWFFPIMTRYYGENKDWYRFSGYVKRYVDGSSFKVELVLTKTDNSTQTITLLPWETAPINWTEKSTIIQMPYSIQTGVINLISNMYGGVYYDNVKFMRCSLDQDKFESTLDPSTSSSDSTTWEQVYSVSYAPSSHEMYSPRTISFSFRLSALDSATAWSRVRIFRNGNQVFSQEDSTTLNTWSNVSWSDSTTYYWGDSIDVRFYLMTTDSQIDVEMKDKKVDTLYQKLTKRW